jgi:hypothetical protein
VWLCCSYCGEKLPQREAPNGKQTFTAPEAPEARNLQSALQLFGTNAVNHGCGFTGHPSLFGTQKAAVKIIPRRLLG